MSLLLDSTEFKKFAAVKHADSSALLCLPQGNVVLNPGEVVPALLISSNPVPPQHTLPHI